MIYNTSHFIWIWVKIEEVLPIFQCINTTLNTVQTIYSFHMRNPLSAHITLQYLPQVIEKNYIDKISKLFLYYSKKDIHIQWYAIDFFLSKNTNKCYCYLKCWISNDILLLRNNLIWLQAFSEVMDNSLPFISHITLCDIEFKEGFTEYDNLFKHLNTVTRDLIKNSNIADNISLYIVDSTMIPELQIPKIQYKLHE